MMDFYDGNVKYRVIDESEDDGDIGFALGLGSVHKICKLAKIHILLCLSFLLFINGLS
jgi:hypothetical protein